MTEPGLLDHRPWPHNSGSSSCRDLHIVWDIVFHLKSNKIVLEIPFDSLSNFFYEGDYEPKKEISHFPGNTRDWKGSGLLLPRGQVYRRTGTSRISLIFLTRFSKLKSVRKCIINSGSYQERHLPWLNSYPTLTEESKQRWTVMGFQGINYWGS